MFDILPKKLTLPKVMWREVIGHLFMGQILPNSKSNSSNVLVMGDLCY